MAKQDKPFNNPFGAVKLKKDEPAKPHGGASQPAPAARPQPARYDAPKGKPSSEDEERAMFLQSVGEVEPVRRPSDRGNAPKPPPPGRGTPDEEEALLQLAELVIVSGAFDLADSDEFIEGSVEGLDSQILRKLRRGDYAIQAQLDLHGLSKAEAREQLEVFLRTAQMRHFRCVLVVQERGPNAQAQLPALRDGLEGWLTRGRVAKQVLAFTSARPQDGGAGAVYVLLRR